ncbi:hypothetical protein [Desulfovibrio sp. ZJ200]|uniref:hypothetical protein n=1 Tax=Desulfovibrio sp. ZJ200 TaxID=2709792 RepID=UPI0013EA8BD4|nr:hypothetical protein [Desulfovibrio sp. ZJ200]
MNSYKQSLYSALIRVMANLLMVGAVFLAMYQAARGASSEITFCLWFFGITVPLWASAFYLNRVIKRRFPAEQESLIDLPRQGRCLVRWRVLEASGRPGLLSR